MQDDVYIDNRMVRSAKNGIPMFKLVTVNHCRFIDYKLSTKNRNRHEYIRISRFAAMLISDEFWSPGELFRSPENSLPMFRMIEVDGIHMAEVMKPHTNITELIHISAIFDILLNERAWKIA